MPLDAKKAARWLKGEFADVEAYVPRQSERGFPEKMRQEVLGAGTSNLGGAGFALRYLANFRAAEGIVKVLGGDEQGFPQIDLACVYAYWLLRARARAWEYDASPDKRPGAEMETVATCWMHAVAIGADEIRSWLDGLVERVDAGEGSVSGKDMNPLCTLMAHFVLDRDPTALKASGWGSIAVYAPVASRSLTPAGYDELASDHTRATDGAGFPAFHFYPYRLVPLELFAIERLTGVPIEGCKHPLLLSPLAAKRDVVQIPPSDELQAFIDRARTELDLP